MENLTGIVSVPLIVAVVYAIMALYKYFIKSNWDTPQNDAKYQKWARMIPVFAGILGMIFGIICYYKIPSIMPADNALVALLIGMASGLAATGANQILKQAKQKSEDEKESEQAEIENLQAMVIALHEKIDNNEDKSL